MGSYGLFKYDVQKNKYFFFKDLPEFSHITRLPTINCISTSKDSTKTLIGTYDGGVYIMEKGKVSKLEPYNNNESDLCVYDIIEDNNGNYWFGTRFGLYYYENKTNRITKINENTLFQTFISIA